MWQSCQIDFGMAAKAHLHNLVAVTGAEPVKYFILATLFVSCICFRGCIAAVLTPRARIKTLREFYSQVEEFSGTLREQGHQDLAEKIERAQLKGSVGSEIVGDIGLALRDVMSELPKALVPKAKELRRFARWNSR